MKTTSVDVELLESSDLGVKVKLPFADIPIEMNHEFFKKRLDCGYFNIVNPDSDSTFSQYIYQYPSQHYHSSSLS